MPYATKISIFIAILLKKDNLLKKDRIFTKNGHQDFELSCLENVSVFSEVDVSVFSSPFQNFVEADKLFFIEIRRLFLVPFYSSGLILLN